MITAKEAREKSQSKESIENIIDDISGRIETAAEFGNTTTIYATPSNPIIIDTLKNNGYTIEDNVNCIRISW